MLIQRLMRAAGAAAGLLVAGAAVHGDTVTFSVFENTQGADVLGLHLRMDLISSAGSSVDAVFRNDSTIDSVVTEVYLESTAFSESVLLHGTIVSPQDPGVWFVLDAAPPNPPGSVPGGAWGGNLMSMSARAPGPHHGLGPGESVTLRFDLGAPYGELVDGLMAAPPEFRVVTHVQGLPGGASVWTVNQGTMAIPSPGAWVCLLGGASLMAIRRRQGGAAAGGDALPVLNELQD